MDLKMFHLISLFQLSLPVRMYIQPQIPVNMKTVQVLQEGKEGYWAV